MKHLIIGPKGAGQEQLKTALKAIGYTCANDNADLSVITTIKDTDFAIVDCEEAETIAKTYPDIGFLILYTHPCPEIKEKLYQKEMNNCPMLNTIDDTLMTVTIDNFFQNTIEKYDNLAGTLDILRESADPESLDQILKIIQITTDQHKTLVKSVPVFLATNVLIQNKPNTLCAVLKGNDFRTKDYSYDVFMTIVIVEEEALIALLKQAFWTGNMIFTLQNPSDNPNIYHIGWDIEKEPAWCTRSICIDCKTRFQNENETCSSCGSKHMARAETAGKTKFISMLQTVRIPTTIPVEQIDPDAGPEIKDEQETSE